jgi:antitoxin ParD1/3/4
MTIVLSADLERMIQERVKSGLYPNPEAVVRAAIAKLLEDEEDFAPGELDALIKIGTDELDRSEGLDGEVVFEELRQMSARVRAGKQP